MSKFPSKFDTDNDLFNVKDALQAVLAFDYHPGQNIIVADRDISNFPSSGIITLIEQCSVPQERSVTFRYGKRTNREFLDLDLKSSKSYFKPKKLTKIVMQVVADHRESLKDSILSIEKYLGVKHTFDKNTIFGRLNNLKKVIFAPKAWFDADVILGVAPLVVNFRFSGSGNTEEVKYIWKFGEEEMETSEPQIEKTFLEVGNHTISLTVKNNYGEDTVKFVDMIKVKGQPPSEAVVSFTPQNLQLVKGDKIRTPVNHPVQVEVVKSVGYSSDPITSYTWNLADDLSHTEHATTKALYTKGGYYDAVVKMKTELGSYRTTIIPNAVDVVEEKNLWLWDINDKKIKSYEFGLVSEVFKVASNCYNVFADDSFLSKEREIFEFWRNNGVINQGRSGLMGTSLIFWASGRAQGDSTATERVNAVEYQGFTDIYVSKNSLTYRPWNWAALVNQNNVYFILGNTEEGPYPTLSMTNQLRTTYDVNSNTSRSENVSYTHYLGGSIDLMKHPDVFNDNFEAHHGHFAAYRTAWKDSTGFLLRNSNLGNDFSFKDFYKTSGTLGTPLQQMVKLPDLPGSEHKEGELVALQHGIYFFNNFGLSYCFNDKTGIWETLPAHNRVAKRELDKLLAVSDGESKAYVILNDKFFKFNELTMTYTSLVGQPDNNPWLMTLY